MQLEDTLVRGYTKLARETPRRRTDIELRALACGYGTTVAPLIDGLGQCAGNANRSPNNTLGDGVDTNDRPFSTTFPYVPQPHQGYQHVHHSSMGGR